MKHGQSVWKTYLLYFAHDLIDFRLPEISSILSLFKIEMKWLRPPSVEPFWLVQLASTEDVHKLASRSVLLRCVVDVWAFADRADKLHSQIRANHINQCHAFKEKSFKIQVETYGKHMDHKQRVDKIETFSYLPLEGPVKLNDPDVTFFFLEYYGIDCNNVPEEPYEIVFGQWLVNGQRDLVTQFSLKKRKFIGNTSMDAQIAFLMANQAKVFPGELVLDPFVGSGSLLVSAAHWGAYVLGTDINYMMLHAKTKPTRKCDTERAADESVLTNMRQYRCEERYIDVLAADASLPLWRNNLTLDAIITDPPYGVRESTDRIGSLTPHEISQEQAATHIPSKISYNLHQVFNDLLIFSSRHLRLGGRLVCFLPVFREDYDDSLLPTHPCFKLIANSEQVLSAVSSRRLLTYEKVAEYDTTSCDDADELKQSFSNLDLFRERYFCHGDESRKEKREKKYAERCERRKRTENGAIGADQPKTQ